MLLLNLFFPDPSDSSLRSPTDGAAWIIRYNLPSTSYRGARIRTHVASINGVAPDWEL